MAECYNIMRNCYTIFTSWFFLFDSIIRPGRLLSFSLPALDYCLWELQVMQITRVSNHDVIYNNPFFSQKSL